MVREGASSLQLRASAGVKLTLCFAARRTMCWFLFPVAFNAGRSLGIHFTAKDGF